MSPPTAEPTEPRARTGAALTRRRDDLNGLVDREAFVRAVDQADRDRDRLMVAVITVDGLAEINQLCGYDAGDRLLGALARALADRASVDLTAGRIGGSQLGLLLTPLGERQPTRLIDAVADDLRRAVEGWLDDRAALGTPSPIVPRPRIGVAAGYGAGTWADAEVAMAVAKRDPDGPTSVLFDLSDHRLATHRRRQRLAEELVDALHRRRLPIDLLSAEPIDDDHGGQPPGTWYRLVSRPALRRRSTTPTDAWHHGLTADDLALAPGLAARLDGHLLATAADVVEGRWPAPSGPSATGRPVSLPVLGPLPTLSSTVAGMARAGEEEAPALPTGIILEVDQRQLLDLAEADDRMTDAVTGTGHGAGPEHGEATPVVTLAERLDHLGWQLAITDFDGGWGAWSLLDRYPVHHLRPAPRLVLAAISGDPIARRLLATAGESADAEATKPVGLSVAAVARDAPGATEERLRQIGVTHIERPLL